MIAEILAVGKDIIQNNLDKEVDTGITLEMGDVVAIIIRAVLWLVGILAVAFIIYGGVKYSMSQGDSAKVKSAKDTIMYAVIGLIVAILAYVIVGFVVERIGGGKGAAPTDDEIPTGEV